MNDIEVLIGTEISKAAECLVAKVQETGLPASMTFNGIVVTATSESSAVDLTDYYAAESDRRAESWRESPEGQESARRTQQNQVDKQRTANHLMAELPALDFLDLNAVIRWCCDIQDASDTFGVILPKRTIVDAFVAKGYKAGDYCGDAFDGENKAVVGHYIVGQAISCLISFGSIHPIIHKFAEDWRKKFP